MKISQNVAKFRIAKRNFAHLHKISKMFTKYREKYSYFAVVHEPSLLKKNNGLKLCITWIWQLRT
jgi:hypothetical protein